MVTLTHTVSGEPVEIRLDAIKSFYPHFHNSGSAVIVDGAPHPIHVRESTSEIQRIKEQAIEASA
jgi:hypothetical protein